MLEALPSDSHGMLMLIMLSSVLLSLVCMFQSASQQFAPGHLALDFHLNHMQNLNIAGMCSMQLTHVLVQVLNQVQERFDVDIKPLPDQVEPSTYMNTA